MNGLVQILESYLMGAKGLGECTEWLAGVDWDDPALTIDQRDALGLFELLVTEVSEGFREEREFWEAASEFVGGRTDSVYAKQTFPEVTIITGTADRPSLPLVEVRSEALELQSSNI